MPHTAASPEPGPRGTGRTGRAGRAQRDRLVARVQELAPEVRRLFDVGAELADRQRWQALTIHQLEAMAALEKGPITMGALCEHLDIAESAGTALCDRLVARGMVERQLDANDRRVVRVALTPDAEAMVARYRRVKRARSAAVLQALGTEELGTLVDIYERLLVASTPARAPR